MNGRRIHTAPIPDNLVIEQEAGERSLNGDHMIEMTRWKIKDAMEGRSGLVGTNWI